MSKFLKALLCLFKGDIPGALNALFKHRVITDCITRDPYLFRWFVIRTKNFGLFIHRFVRSDYERVCHDHPWNFLVIPVWRGYIEHSEVIKSETIGCREVVRRCKRVWPIIGTRARFAEYRHRVELIKAKATITPEDWKRLCQLREDLEAVRHVTTNRLIEIETEAEIRDLAKIIDKQPYDLSEKWEVTHRELPSWSIFIRLRERRDWGFWLPEGWKKWNIFERERCN